MTRFATGLPEGPCRSSVHISVMTCSVFLHAPKSMAQAVSCDATPACKHSYQFSLKVYPHAALASLVAIIDLHTSCNLALLLFMLICMAVSRN